MNEMEAVTELHRRSLIRLMNATLARTPCRTQWERTLRQAQGRLYDPEVDDALRVIAQSLDYICPQRCPSTWCGWPNIWQFTTNWRPPPSFWLSRTGTQARPRTHKRRYEQAHRPFDRLCETDAINQNEGDQLETLREGTGRRKLRQEIYQLIDYLFSLPNAVQERTENVHEALVFPLTFHGKGADAPVSILFFG